jgi:hypothetical protein
MKVVKVQTTDYQFISNNARGASKKYGKEHLIVGGEAVVTAALVSSYLLSSSLQVSFTDKTHVSLGRQRYAGCDKA